MLKINFKPVDVDFGPQVPSLPFTRHRRLREVDCSTMNSCNDYPRDSNPMYDQRVIRGSNFVRLKPQPPAPQPSLAVRRKFCEARNRLLEKQRLQREAKAQGTRKHVNVQCERVSPAVMDTWPLTSEGTTQTDLTPSDLQQRQRSFDLIVRCKTGVDASTQVNVRDLIDFETEAFPVTEMLVSRVLEMAAVCVLYEDDAAALRREQAVYEKRRRAEIVELNRLEHEEVINRKQGMRALERAERAAPGPTYQVLHGRALAHQYMSGLRDDALGQLLAAGYLRGDEYELAGWLRGRIRGQPRRRANADAFLNSLICNVIVKHTDAPQPTSPENDDQDVMSK